MFVQLVLASASTGTDAPLSDLVLKNAADDAAVALNPAFDSAPPPALVYAAAVANGVTRITLEATASSAGATVEYLDMPTARPSTTPTATPATATK